MQELMKRENVKVKTNISPSLCFWNTDLETLGYKGRQMLINA